MSYSIAEISRQTGLSSQTLRVWEDAGLVQANRDENGIRIFCDDIFSRLERIQILKGFGLSLSDISAIFSGLKPEHLRDLLLQRREEIEQEALRLSRARQKLRQVEDLLGGFSGPQTYSDFLVSPERAKENALAKLLVEGVLDVSDAHREYLNSEFACLSPEESVAQIALFKRLVRYGESHGIPLNFVRGHGSTRLALHLCGWKTVDPVSERLYPRYVIQKRPELHFDVPYSIDQSFYDFLREAGSETEHLKLVAYRLPILDIMRDFSERTGYDYKSFEPEESILDLLRSGHCSDVFMLDESGDTLVERLFPESSELHRSVDAVSADMKRWQPKSRLDVFRFIALRREHLKHLFSDYMAGRPFASGGCVAKLLPEENRGFVFFHEELIDLIHKATDWDLPRVFAFRVAIAKNRVSDEDKADFIRKSDAASYEWVRDWSTKTFCKSHLLGWWSTSCATASCKLRSEQAWLAVKRQWEQNNQMSWNNFGVTHSGAKILTE